MAASLLAQSPDADAKARLLPGIASGARIAAVAVTGDRGLWTLDDVAVTARPSGNGWALDGAASYVLSANIADVILVVAKAPDGIGVFEVDPAGSGVSRQTLELWDRTLRLSRINFADTPAIRIAGLDGDAVERMLDMARVALAGEQAGACRRIFDMTVSYLKTRVQFGRPIGGFQALKHMAADLLIDVESAVSAAREAARGGSECAVSGVAGGDGVRKVFFFEKKNQKTFANFKYAMGRRGCHRTFRLNYD
jgi:alkylation response protein AidB-like acyl-CoA dehydrogenase